MSNQHQELINKYVKAKDEHKPHLMKNVFTDNATLEMKVQSDNISFPSNISGLNGITETLVREFNQSYENVYTICLVDTVEKAENTLNCRWLVGMTDKSSGSCKVGFGDYHWVFEEKEGKLVKRLTITIENMVILPQEYQPEVMSWLDNLPYPWAPSSEILASSPNIQLLSDMRSNII